MTYKFCFLDHPGVFACCNSCHGRSYTRISFTTACHFNRHNKGARKGTHRHDLRAGSCIMGQFCSSTSDCRRNRGRGQSIRRRVQAYRTSGLTLNVESFRWRASRKEAGDANEGTRRVPDIWGQYRRVSTPCNPHRCAILRTPGCVHCTSEKSRTNHRWSDETRQFLGSCVKNHSSFGPRSRHAE